MAVFRPNLRGARRDGAASGPHTPAGGLQAGLARGKPASYEARVILRADLFRFAGALAAALIAVGCLPKIGDHCTTSLDCSQTGQRLCDTTQPDGYCTVFNC